MIDTLALRMAAGIKRAVPEHPVSEAVLKYALIFILNAASIILLSLLVALFTGRVGETVSVLVFFALLRQLSGGLHLKSGVWCVAVSTAGVTAISFASFSGPAVIGITAAAAILVLLYAPSGIEKQTRIPPRFYPLLKLLSFLLVCSNLLLGSAVVGTAFLVQAITLIRGRR